LDVRNRSYVLTGLFLKLHGINHVGFRTSEALYIATERGRRSRRVGIYCRHIRIGTGCGTRTKRMAIVRGESIQEVEDYGADIENAAKKAQNIREYRHVYHQKSPEGGYECRRD